MSNLFALADSNGLFYVEGDKPLYFSNKQDAKAKRCVLNPKDNEGNEVFNWVVARGPDHRLGPRKSGFTPKQGSGAKRKKAVYE